MKFLKSTVAGAVTAAALTLSANTALASNFNFDPRALQDAGDANGLLDDGGIFAAYEAFINGLGGADGFCPGGGGVGSECNSVANVAEMRWALRNVKGNVNPIWAVFIGRDGDGMEVGDPFVEDVNFLLTTTSSVTVGIGDTRLYNTDFVTRNTSFVFMRARLHGTVAAIQLINGQTVPDLAYDGVSFEMCFDRDTTGTSHGGGGGTTGAALESATYDCDISLLTSNIGSGFADFGAQGNVNAADVNWNAVVDPSTVTPGAFVFNPDFADIALVLQMQFSNFRTASDTICGGGFTDDDNASDPADTWDCRIQFLAPEGDQTTEFAIPEPGTLALLGMGLLGLGAASRKRRAA